MKKRIFCFVLCLITVCSLLCIAVSATIPGEPAESLKDGANLLSDSEKAKLSSKLKDYTEKHDVQIAIVTIDGLDGEDAKDVADALYDKYSFGVGEERNGVMLLISVDEELGEDGRDYAVRIYGDTALDAIGDSEYESIMDEVLPSLRSDNFYTAFVAFADECEYYINGEINGFPFDYGKKLVISLIIGLVVALIATSVMKGKLKSVRFQSAASNYVKDGSMNVTVSRDFFLYRNITRTAKPKDNSSSSGRSSGGGRTYSGKF